MRGSRRAAQIRGYRSSTESGPHWRTDVLLFFHLCHSFLPWKFSFFISHLFSMYFLSASDGPDPWHGARRASERRGLCFCGAFRPGQCRGPGRGKEGTCGERKPPRDVIDTAQGWSGQASQRRGHFSRDLHVEKKQKLSDT